MPRVQIDIPDIRKIVRKKQYDSLLTTYKPSEKSCPHCGVQRRKFLKKICSDECLDKVLDTMMLSGELYYIMDDVAAIYAKKNHLPNGQTIHYSRDDYRNTNLLFWDANNEKIVHPFNEIDDYGSVPPIFPVGHGYFNPTDWLDEVEHNTYVFPARPFINEMKKFVAEHPGEKKMVVNINGKDYDVYYNEAEMEGNWDSCVLELCLPVEHGDLHRNDRLYVYRGDPEWRKDIIDEVLPSKPEIQDAKPHILCYEQVIPETNTRRLVNLLFEERTKYIQDLDRIKTQIRTIQLDLQTLLMNKPR